MDLYFTNFSIFDFTHLFFTNCSPIHACTCTVRDQGLFVDLFSRIVSITSKLVKYESLEIYTLYGIIQQPVCMCYCVYVFNLPSLKSSKSLSLFNLSVSSSSVSSISSSSFCVGLLSLLI